jgi:hypothetical protein
MHERASREGQPTTTAVGPNAIARRAERRRTAARATIGVAATTGQTHVEECQIPLKSTSRHQETHLVTDAVIECWSAHRREQFGTRNRLHRWQGPYIAQVYVASLRFGR